MKMTKTLLTCLFTILCLTQAVAEEISTEFIGEGKWVTLKTGNGYYFCAIKEGQEYKLGQSNKAPTASNYAAYCWKISGNATDGYKFRCLGYMDYNNSGFDYTKANDPNTELYITNPTTIGTNSYEVRLTTDGSEYFYTNTYHQLQLKDNNSMYLAYYSQNYHTIRLHNSSNYGGSQITIGGIYDWSVAAVVYGTETVGQDGIPQGTYLANGGVKFGGQNYLHGSSLRVDDVTKGFEIITIEGYTQSTIKIDHDNHYIVVYYIGKESNLTYSNANTTKESHPVVTGADNTIWSLNAKDYITNTSGNYTTVPVDKAWQMEMVVQNTNTSGNDPSFNRWGSCILSSNGDPINTYYWGDFQVYQHAPTHSSPNTLNFKSSKADGNDHIIAQGASVANKNYKVIVRFNGQNVYIIRTIILDDQLNETNEVYNNVWVSARKQNEINQMSCALPTGLNLYTLRISIAEESNLMEDVDYAIQNITQKYYLTGKSAGDDTSWRTPYGGEAAKFQIKWTGIPDLTYSETDGGLHNSFYIKLIDHEGNAKWLGANNVNVDDMANAQAFVYTTSQHVAPITTKDQISDSWGIGEDKAWFWDFFANFYVEVAGNNNGGLQYHRNNTTMTAQNGQYIELPSGVSTTQMANSSQAGYMAAISKQDIRLKVQYTPLENTFYNITSKTDGAQPTLYYWYKDRQEGATLVTYSTGNVEAWGEKGDCSKFTINKATTIPVKLNQNTAGVDPDQKYYGTIFSPNALKLPAGVTAYAAKDNGATMRMIKIADGGNILPAKTAAILQCDEYTAPLNIELNTNDNSTLDSNITNNLDGTFVTFANPNDGTYYTLSGKNGIGFYRYTGANLNAFKAFCHSGSSTAARMTFTFDETTDIDNLQTEAENKDAVIYDLLGRRLTNTTKGIYIINGKKVLK